MFPYVFRSWNHHPKTGKIEKTIDSTVGDKVERLINIMYDNRMRWLGNWYHYTSTDHAIDIVNHVKSLKKNLRTESKSDQCGRLKGILLNSRRVYIVGRQGTVNKDIKDGSEAQDLYLNCIEKLNQHLNCGL